VRVAVVAEYYPRAADPVLGVWAHRQALAARDAGADVRVLVLHRPVPSRAALKTRTGLLDPLRQPPRTELDGIEVTYVPFLAPPRPRTYASWGAWAAPTLALALRRARPFDLVHAHYAAPAGDAVRRARPGVPVVVSVHGGDVLSVVHRPGGEETVRKALENARVVLANSTGTEERARSLGAVNTRVVHLGTDVPPRPRREPDPPVVATVGHLVARKRHADVLRALWLLREEHPHVRWVVAGDGPEREGLERMARELGVRADFRGQLAPAEAVKTAQEATVFALPSVDEAFGVAYIEAMAAGVPAIGCRGEAGPEEIRASGGGIRLVAPGDPESLAEELRRLLDDTAWRRELGEAARATVEREFTWEACGRATVAAYEEALR
jgi:glycosyltransferase involved in cell wall biosynthesis